MEVHNPDAAAPAPAYAVPAASPPPERAAFRLCSLASGSSGNAYYVESAEGAVVVDAGLSGKPLVEAITRVGGRPERVRAVVVTHDHRDHAFGAGVLARRHGWPLVMTRGTWERAARFLGKIAQPGLCAAGGVVTAAGFAIECHATPHDAAEPLALVVTAGGRRCGLLTDLGHAFAGLADIVGDLDAVFLESNYNDEMLARNPAYPPPLKHRIRSPRGHLENRETGALLAAHAGERLRTVVLAHLSENNNRPELARREVAALAGDRLAALGATLLVAPRHDPSPWVYC